MSRTNKEALSDYLGKKTPTTKFGSNSVGGDKNIDGEIVIKQDGSKRRRSVVKSSSSVASGDGEIITLEDGRKVRRIKKKKKSSSKDDKKDGKKNKQDDKKSKKSSRKSLGSFLGTTETRKLGGSSSVAGDKIAIGKESSLTGKDYIREDGQRKNLTQKKSAKESASDDNIISVEYVKRADGTTVKRIKKKVMVKKKKSKDDGDDTASAKSDKKKEDKSKKKATADKKKPQLGSFLNGEDQNKPNHAGENRTVAGDQLTVGKTNSPTGEKIVRDDGKRIATKPKAKSKVEPGDRVEIVTLADGRKIRRIFKAKKKPAADSTTKKDESVDATPPPTTLKAQVSAPQSAVPSRPGTKRRESKTLEDFMGGKKATNSKPTGSSSVGGDIVQNNEKPAPVQKPKLPRADGPARPSKITLDKVPPLPSRAGFTEPVVSSDRVSKTLAVMSTMGNDYDGMKMAELLRKLEEAEKRQEEAEKKQKEAEQRELKLQVELEEAKKTLSNVGGDVDLAQKLVELEKQKAILEKQLLDANIDPAENIAYEECIRQIQAISLRLEEIGGHDVTHEDKDKELELRKEYHTLSNEMDRYNTALINTEEFQKEEERKENEWHNTNEPINQEAMRKIRRHMPVEVFNISEKELMGMVTPSDRKLPPAIARRFKRTNVLQLLRRDPADIQRMHPNTLELFRVVGLTLTERRALYEHLRPNAKPWKKGRSDKATAFKWTWFSTLKDNFKEELDKYNYHMEKFGPPENHKCNMHGKACPLRANQAVNYDGDYGFTSEAAYEKPHVTKTKVDDIGAARAEALEILKGKRANDRGEALKAHHKGVLQVSKAKGACEDMDSLMDEMEFVLEQWTKKALEKGDGDSKLTDDVKKKEIAEYRENLKGCKMTIQNMCGRAAMSLSGVDKGDDKPDPRSAIECSLAEEVQEAFAVYTKWISDRLAKIEMRNDVEIKNIISMLADLLSKLHEKNISTLKALGVKREKRSRPLKTAADIEAEVKKKQSEQSMETSSSKSAPAVRPAGPPLGGMLDQINAKKKPNPLMAAILGGKK